MITLDSGALPWPSDRRCISMFQAERLRKDRRNSYGENSKSSRKNIPRAKARDHREARRVARQTLTAARGAVSDETADEVQTAATTKRHPRFKKEPDLPVTEGPQGCAAWALPTRRRAR